MVLFFLVSDLYTLCYSICHHCIYFLTARLCISKCTSAIEISINYLKLNYVN
uniref:Uncharacterized protein n=1 Tax=Arundo donax TaxID=35708 RepID=A0A0A9DTD2_ARUDO